MKKFTTKAVLLSAGALLALCALTTTIARAGDGDGEATVALPAPAIISAINTAIAAKPGNIKSVEAETEGGVSQIEIEIIATDDGKEYDVTVDATGTKVLNVEAELPDAPVEGAMDAPVPVIPVPEVPLPDNAE